MTTERAPHSINGTMGRITPSIMATADVARERATVNATRSMRTPMAASLPLLPPSTPMTLGSGFVVRSGAPTERGMALSVH